jgi:hypothetical protein
MGCRSANLLGVSVAIQVAATKYVTEQTEKSCPHVFLCLAASDLSLETYASLPGQSNYLLSVCVKTKRVFFAPSAASHFSNLCLFIYFNST